MARAATTSGASSAPTSAPATFPEGVDELYFNVAGVIKDLDRLKLLYELFAETLDQLCLTGAAYAANPNFGV